MDENKIKSRVLRGKGKGQDHHQQKESAVVFPSAERKLGIVSPSQRAEEDVSDAGQCCFWS